MIGRFERSFELLKASWSVVKADKELLWLPIVSSIAGLVVAASFLIPAIGTGSLQLWAQTQDPLIVVWAFGFYAAGYFVTFYFNAALVGAALMRLHGEDPTLGDALGIASSRIGAILGYALIAATVGLFLRMLEDRVGWLGRWIVALLGTAWTLATFLAVPVLIAEDVGPLDAVRRSATMLKTTWGENLIGNTGLGLAFALIYVGLGLGLVGSLVVATKLHMPALGVVMFALAIVALVFLVSLHATLRGVYAAALYRYASGADPDAAFAGGHVRDAFVPKGGRTVRR